MGDRRWRAPVVLLGATVLLVGGVSVVGDDTTDLPTAEPGVLLQGSDPWCPQSSSQDASAGRFALDGRVATSRQGAVGSLLGIEVVTWLRGPPVGRVEVEVAGAPDGGFRVGDRLLVQGSWRPDGGHPVIDRCRARTWTASLARAWEVGAGRAGPEDGAVALPGDPVSRYDAVGFRRTGEAGGPVLTGLLVREGDCVYVADGRTRWLPVFPSEQVRWDPAAERVLLAAHPLGVGQEVRLGGSPERGDQPRRGQPAVPGEGGTRMVDPAGVPTGCDPDAPRFVVGEAVAGAWTSEVLATGDPLVRAVREASRTADLAPSAVAGRLELDDFDGESLHFLVTATAGPLAGDVAVSIGTVPVQAWPDAFDTDDATVRSTRDGPLRALPTRSGDSELVLVERPGRTHVMVRTPGGRVVSVTVALPASDERVWAMAGLAEAVAAGD